MVVMQAARNRWSSTALLTATAVVVGLHVFVWTKSFRRRRTAVPEPVDGRLPVGLGLE